MARGSRSRQRGRVDTASGRRLAPMKYLSEYRDARIAKSLARRIRATATRRWVLMEVCGGQTHTIVRQGIDELVGDAVEMIHGPGCPVCVTPLEQIDRAVALAARPDVIFTSFGDMLRVPGSECDLQQVTRTRRHSACRVFAARRRGAGAAQSGQAGRLLCRRLRDHGAGERHGGLARAAVRRAQLLHAGLARHACRRRWSRFSSRQTIGCRAFSPRGTSAR